MKIRELQLKNIGVFNDQKFKFQECPKAKAEIHIFTGQNGSGKSTILMALASVFDNYEREFLPSNLRNDFSKRFRDTHGENGILVNFEDSTESFLRIYNAIVYSDYKPFPSNGGSIGLLEREHKLFAYKAWSSSKPYYRDMLLEFAVFAYSGYRRIESERVEAIKESKWFSPLSQALNFVKDYTLENELSINQLIVNNISKSAIEKDRNKSKSEKFAKVLMSIEQIISEITGWEIKFDLQTEPLSLTIKVNDEELDFDTLPDGLRSLISWIADLLGRIDLLSWLDDLPIFEKNLILLLDEIEVHLHPAWQRKVLPVVQKLFKNSQIFVSTHSPFVVNSIDDAWIYKLKLENGKAKVAEVIKSEDGFSYSHVLSEIFDIEEEFGVEVQKDLAKFKVLRNKILATKNGSDKTQKEFLKLAKSLAIQSEELQTIVQFELRQLSKRIGKNLTI